MTHDDQVLMCATFLMVCVANELFIGRLRRSDPDLRRNAIGYFLTNLMNWLNAGFCAGTLIRMWLSK